MVMLVMTILVYFLVLYTKPLSHLHAPEGPTCGTALQPSYLAHARLVRCLVWTPHLRVLCALAAHTQTRTWP
jgi:hypothetical protein